MWQALSDPCLLKKALIIPTPKSLSKLREREKRNRKLIYPFPNYIWM